MENSHVTLLSSYSIYMPYCIELEIESTDQAALCRRVKILTWGRLPSLSAQTLSQQCHRAQQGALESSSFVKQAGAVASSLFYCEDCTMSCRFSLFSDCL